MVNGLRANPTPSQGVGFAKPVIGTAVRVIGTAKRIGQPAERAIGFAVRMTGSAERLAHPTKRAPGIAKPMTGSAGEPTRSAEPATEIPVRAARSEKQIGYLDGAARRTRTPNPQIRSLPLYPLSYGCTVLPYSIRPVMGDEAEA
jgi:hypothetical protein